MINRGTGSRIPVFDRELVQGPYSREIIRASKATSMGEVGYLVGAIANTIHELRQ